MNKTTLTMALITGTLATGAQGQLLAHWDYPGFVADTANYSDCLTYSNTKVGVGHSTQNGGSEGSSQYHCFGSWDVNLNTNKYVSYKVKFDPNATGSVDNFNFDVRTYNDGYWSSSHATEFFVEWFLDGASQGSFDTGTDGIVPTVTTTFEDYNITLNGLDASLGNTAEIRFTAYDRNGHTNGIARIGLDNVRLLGSAHCVPEPSTGLLALLSACGFIARRRR